MTTLGIKYFGGQIVWSSANCLLLLTLVEHLSRETKVTDFQLHSFSKEQIAEFQIAMDHFLCVDVFACLDELVDVISSFDLMEAFASADEV